METLKWIFVVLSTILILEASAYDSTQPNIGPNFANNNQFNALQYKNLNFGAATNQYQGAIQNGALQKFGFGSRPNYMQLNNNQRNFGQQNQFNLNPYQGNRGFNTYKPLNQQPLNSQNPLTLNNNIQSKPAQYGAQQINQPIKTFSVPLNLGSKELKEIRLPIPPNLKFKPLHVDPGQGNILEVLKKVKKAEADVEEALELSKSTNSAGEIKSLLQLADKELSHILKDIPGIGSTDQQPIKTYETGQFGKPPLNTFNYPGTNPETRYLPNQPYNANRSGFGASTYEYKSGVPGASSTASTAASSSSIIQEDSRIIPNYGYPGNTGASTASAAASSSNQGGSNILNYGYNNPGNSGASTASAAASSTIQGDPSVLHNGFNPGKTGASTASAAAFSSIQGGSNIPNYGYNPGNTGASTASAASSSTQEGSNIPNYGYNPDNNGASTALAAGPSFTQAGSNIPNYGYNPGNTGASIASAAAYSSNQGVSNILNYGYNKPGNTGASIASAAASFSTKGGSNIPNYGYNPDNTGASTASTAASSFTQGGSNIPKYGYNPGNAGASTASAASSSTQEGSNILNYGSNPGNTGASTASAAAFSSTQIGSNIPNYGYNPGNAGASTASAASSSTQEGSNVPNYGSNPGNTGASTASAAAFSSTQGGSNIPNYGYNPGNAGASTASAASSSTQRGSNIPNYGSNPGSYGVGDSKAIQQPGLPSSDGFNTQESASSSARANNGAHTYNPNNYGQQPLNLNQPLYHPNGLHTYGVPTNSAPSTTVGSNLAVYNGQGYKNLDNGAEAASSATSQSGKSNLYNVSSNKNYTNSYTGNYPSNSGPSYIGIYNLGISPNTYNGKDNDENYKASIMSGYDVNQSSEVSTTTDADSTSNKISSGAEGNKQSAEVVAANSETTPASPVPSSDISNYNSYGYSYPGNYYGSYPQQVGAKNYPALSSGYYANNDNREVPTQYFENGTSDGDGLDNNSNSVASATVDSIAATQSQDGTDSKKVNNKLPNYTAENLQATASKSNTTTTSPTGSNDNSKYNPYGNGYPDKYPGSYPQQAYDGKYPNPSPGNYLDYENQNNDQDFSDNTYTKDQQGIESQDENKDLTESTVGTQISGISQKGSKRRNPKHNVWKQNNGVPNYIQPTEPSTSDSGAAGDGSISNGFNKNDVNTTPASNSYGNYPTQSSVSGSSEANAQANTSAKSNLTNSNKPGHYRKRNKYPQRRRNRWPKNRQSQNKQSTTESSADFYGDDNNGQTATYEQTTSLPYAYQSNNGPANDSPTKSSDEDLYYSTLSPTTSNYGENHSYNQYPYDDGQNGYYPNRQRQNASQSVVSSAAISWPDTSENSAPAGTSTDVESYPSYPYYGNDQSAYNQYLYNKQNYKGQSPYGQQQPPYNSAGSTVDNQQKDSSAAEESSNTAGAYDASGNSYNGNDQSIYQQYPYKQGSPDDQSIYTNGQQQYPDYAGVFDDTETYADSDTNDNSGSYATSKPSGTSGSKPPRSSVNSESSTTFVSSTTSDSSATSGSSTIAGSSTATASSTSVSTESKSETTISRTVASILKILESIEKMLSGKCSDDNLL